MIGSRPASTSTQLRASAQSIFPFGDGERNSRLDPFKRRSSASSLPPPRWVERGPGARHALDVLEAAVKIAWRNGQRRRARCRARLFTFTWWRSTGVMDVQRRLSAKRRLDGHPLPDFRVHMQEGLRVGWDTGRRISRLRKRAAARYPLAADVSPNSPRRQTFRT